MNTRSFALLVAFVGLAGMLVLVGCQLNPFDGRGVDGAMLGKAPSAAQSGPASVRFALQVYPDLPRDVQATVRAEASAAQSVEFRLTVLDPANATSTVHSKTVPVGLGGIASATFTNLPAKTAIGQITLTGCNIAGFKDFIGGLDLMATGENTMTCSPFGTGQVPDLIGRTLLDLIDIPAVLASLPANAAARIGTAVQTPAITSSQGANQIPTTDEMINNAVAMLNPSRGTEPHRLEIGTDSQTLSLFASGTLVWKRTAAEIFAGTPLFGADVAGLRIGRIMYQPRGTGHSYVLFRHATAMVEIVARFNVAGTTMNFCKIPGLFQAWSSRNGLEFMGAFHNERRCPVVFRWNPETDGRLTSTSEGAHNVLWETFFPEIVPTAAQPWPPVQAVSYGGDYIVSTGMLLCCILDPRSASFQTFRLDATLGAPLAEPPATAPVSPPIPVITIASPTHGTVVTAGSSFEIIASASVDRGTIKSVQFYDYGNEIANVTTAPYTCRIASITVDRHELRTGVTTDGGTIRRSSIVVIEAVPSPTAPSTPAVKTFVIATAATGVDGSVIDIDGVGDLDDVQLTIDTTGTEPRLQVNPPMRGPFALYAEQLGRFMGQLPPNDPYFMWNLRLTHWLTVANVPTLDTLTDADISSRIFSKIALDSGHPSSTGPLAAVVQSAAKNLLIIGPYTRVGNLFKVVIMRINDMTTTGFVGQNVEYRTLVVDATRFASQFARPLPEPMPILVAPRIAQVAAILGKSVTGIPDVTINGLWSATIDPVMPNIATETPWVFNDRGEAFNFIGYDYPGYRCWTPPHQIDGHTNCFAPLVYTSYGTKPYVQLFRNGSFTVPIPDPAEPWRIKFPELPTHVNIILGVDQSLPRSVGATPTMRLRLEMSTGMQPIVTYTEYPNPLPAATYTFRTDRPGSLAVLDPSTFAPLVNVRIDEVQMTGSYNRIWHQEYLSYEQVPLATGTFRMTIPDTTNPYTIVGSFNHTGLTEATVSRGATVLGSIGRVVENSSGYWTYTDQASQMTTRDGIGWIE